VKKEQGGRRKQEAKKGTEEKNKDPVA